MSHTPSSDPPPITRGLLLFAHGARDPNWARPFEAVAGHVAQADRQCRVRLAFLEFMTPDLPTAGDALVAEGCTQVDVVPLFLGAGGHVRKDLPALMQVLQSRHPQVRWALHRAVGEEDRVARAMAEAALELAGRALAEPGR